MGKRFHVILSSKEDEADVLKVCEDIVKKDHTFDYHVHDGYICLLCDDKDRAHKRGMWFKYKVGVKNYVVVVE